MLYFDFSSMFKLRGISNPYRLLIQNGIAPKTAQNLVHSPVKTIRLEHLEIICRALNCTPNDVIRYKADEAKPLAEDHALKKIENKIDVSVTDMLKKISLEQLQQIAIIMQQQKL